MFAGCIEKDNTGLGQQLTQMLRSGEGLAGVPYDYSGAYQIDNAVFVEQSHGHHKHNKHTDGITVHAQTGVVILGWLRIDNRNELISQLRHQHPGCSESDHHTVVAAYLHWGQAFVERLIGDFSLVIYDPRTRKLLLARDQIGARPLYYYQDDSVFLFATSISIITALGDSLELALSEQWLANYLLNCSHDWQQSPYQKISKVPPAHFIEHCNHDLRQVRYFDFNPEPYLNLASDADYVEAYQEILNEAVRCRSISDFPVGAESSGGMDSSTITALAARYITDPKNNFHTFAFAICEREPECIFAVSQATPMKATHVVSQGPPINNIHANTWNKFMQHVGTPCEHFSSLSHAPLLEIAQTMGVRNMLSGFGGDEFVTAYAALTRVELWEKKLLSDWVALYPGNAVTAPLRALKWLYRYRKNSNCFETATAAAKATARIWQTRLLNNTVCKQYSLHQRLINRSNYDAGYTSVNDFALNDRWSPSMSARMENCSLFAAGYGIEYSWPLLDLRLVNFFLSVPSQQKLGPKGVSRYLHRRSIKGVVPDLIVEKSKEMGDLACNDLDSTTNQKAVFPDFDELPKSLAGLLDRNRYLKFVSAKEHDEGQHREMMNFTSLKKWLELSRNN